MIQVNRIYLIFNRLVTKKFLVDTSDLKLYDTYALLIYIAYTIMFFYPNGFSFKSPSLSPGGPVEPPVSGAPPM